MKFGLIDMMCSWISGGAFVVIAYNVREAIKTDAPWLRGL